MSIKVKQGKFTGMSTGTKGERALNILFTAALDQFWLKPVKTEQNKQNT